MRLAIIPLLLLACGCRLETAPADWQNTAYMKLGNCPDPTPAWVDDHAQYDFVALTWGAWADPRMQNVGERMRARNPDIHLGTYVSTHACPPWMRDAPEGTWARRWWDAMSTHLAFTTEGDTAAIFKNAYVWNVLDPAARADAVVLLNAYAREQHIDWAMLDFITVPMPNLKVWQDPKWEAAEAGDLDFNQNGVGHWNDPGEQAALRVAWGRFMAEIRASLPAGFLLIPNGALAIQDPSFSKDVDGCYVEGFPRWFFGSGDSMDYGAALHPANAPTSLPNLAAPGRWHSPAWFVMIEDAFQCRQLGYVAALYPGVVETFRGGDGTDTIALPVDLSWLGQPTGAAAFKVPQTTRTFEHGVVVVEAGKGTLRTSTR